MEHIETNLQEAVKRLEQMQISGTQLEKTLFTLTKKVIQQARTKVSGDIRGTVGSGYPNSHGDPREAYRAVKHMIYKQILGGNISILNPKRRSGKMAPLPSSRRSKMRSSRTKDLLSYYGSDRGFILRFLNSGTRDRVLANTFNNSGLGDVMDRRNSRRRYKGGPYNRGQIAPRNFFRSAGQKEMEWAAQQLAALIEQEIEKLR